MGKHYFMYNLVSFVRSRYCYFLDLFALLVVHTVWRVACRSDLSRQRECVYQWFHYNTRDLVYSNATDAANGRLKNNDHPLINR